LHFCDFGGCGAIVGDGAALLTGSGIFSKVIFHYPHNLVIKSVFARLAVMDLDFVNCLPYLFGDDMAWGGGRVLGGRCGLIFQKHFSFRGWEFLILHF